MGAGRFPSAITSMARIETPNWTRVLPVAIVSGCVVTSAQKGLSATVPRPGELRLERQAVASKPNFWRRIYRSAFANYAVAVPFVVLALVSSMLLQQFFPYPFLFLFFAAVMAAAWVGGIGPGLFAVFLATLAIDYYFVRPLHSLVINATDSTYFGAFVVCALVASWVSSAKKHDQEALRDARDLLESRVAERTSELRHANAELEESIRQREKVQQAHIETQAELAHLSRFLTMGELTASIAHEVNQPLTAVVTFGNACLEWLAAEPPNIAEARLAAERIVADGTRAGAVLSRIRSAFQKRPPSKSWFPLNDAISELLALIQHEAARNGVALRTQLAPDLPEVRGDRVRLQQVILNLVVNAIDATRESSSGSREILIRCQREGASGILVSVEDNGPGFAPGLIEKIFDPFFTTKPQGIGMGLSISRSIIESHQGRLWAAPRPSGGAIVQFTLPVGS